MPNKQEKQEAPAREELAATRGRAFLAGLMDPELELLPEFRGHSVYWLFHDNYLVVKTLSKSHPKLAATIQKSIKKYDEAASGKIEILFGEAKQPLPFRHHDLVVVKKVGERTIRTERTKKAALKGWEQYADLLFFATIARAGTETKLARKHFHQAMQMWDERGFRDVVVEKSDRYATYKLALAILARERLAKHIPAQEQLPWEAATPPMFVSKLLALQDESGGWITDYLRDGKPIGKANVETSCLAILALDVLQAAQKASTQPNTKAKASSNASDGRPK